jgi:histidine triad (HIT) family protein
MSDCLFCKIAAGEIPSRKVYADDDFYAFEDINPQAPTHILVIPRKHFATLNDVGEDDAELMGKMFMVTRRIAKDKGLDAKGYRLTANCLESAGQSVFHIHFHLMGGRPFGWPPG